MKPAQNNAAQEQTRQFSRTLDRCAHFYRQYGAAMIHREFPAYETRIAVGLAGEGSDCFGYDDQISADHDYGIGFCLWLSELDFHAIGRPLQLAYQKLTEQYASYYPLPTGQTGYAHDVHTRLTGRRGVMTMDRFFRQLLGCVPDPDRSQGGLTEQMWLAIPEAGLAAAVNGVIFRDDTGVFSRIRRLLTAHYPEAVRRKLLAGHLHLFSQNGQYNYPRMMARGDLFTARLCMAQAQKSAMHAAYLLCRRYAPHDKWMRKGLDALPSFPGLGQTLDAMARLENQESAWTNESYSPIKINDRDQNCVQMEIIAAMLLEELRRQELADGHDLFLELYCDALWNS